MIFTDSIMLYTETVDIHCNELNPLRTILEELQTAQWLPEHKELRETITVARENREYPRISINITGRKWRRLSRLQSLWIIIPEVS
jgi:hypothetical protein